MEHQQTAEQTTPEDKNCALCGRRIEWRAKWKDTWDEIKRCSARCRRLRLGELDQRLENTIVTLLSTRARGSSMCPSEAAREVAPKAWKDLMERTRWAGNRLVVEGRLVVLQGGRVVDPSTAKGPIRYGLLQ